MFTQYFTKHLARAASISTQQQQQKEVDVRASKRLAKKFILEKISECDVEHSEIIKKENQLEQLRVIKKPVKLKYCDVDTLSDQSSDSTQAAEDKRTQDLEDLDFYYSIELMKEDYKSQIVSNQKHILTKIYNKLNKKHTFITLNQLFYEVSNEDKAYTLEDENTDSLDSKHCAYFKKARLKLFDAMNQCYDLLTVAEKFELGKNKIISILEKKIARLEQPSKIKFWGNVDNPYEVRALINRMNKGLVKLKTAGKISEVLEILTYLQSTISYRADPTDPIYKAAALPKRVLIQLKELEEKIKALELSSHKTKKVELKPLENLKF